jgi:hypothetical protein
MLTRHQSSVAAINANDVSGHDLAFGNPLANRQDASCSNEWTLVVVSDEQICERFISSLLDEPRNFAADGHDISRRLGLLRLRSAGVSYRDNQ